jgi:hypothetical protein
LGELHRFQLPESSRHSNLFRELEDVNWNDADWEVTVPLGPEVIVVSGAAPLARALGAHIMQAIMHRIDRFIALYLSWFLVMESAIAPVTRSP